MFLFVLYLMLGFQPVFQFVAGLLTALHVKIIRPLLNIFLRAVFRLPRLMTMVLRFHKFRYG